MAKGIKTGDPRGFNKGRSSKFCEGSRVRQTPEEGRRTYRPKRGNNDKDEDNSPKTLNVDGLFNVEVSLCVRVCRVFTNGPAYQRLKKMVLDTSLLNTQQYKARIKGKVEQSREKK